MDRIPLSNFSKLFVSDTPLIDVRAPVEFTQGSLPGAMNLPIMNDTEREQVGTIYKHQGQAAAIALGHELVAGDIKQSRVESWLRQIQKNPATVVYCFRGGLRSQTAQLWLRDIGVDVAILEGGYKKARQFFLEELDRLSLTREFLILSGPTGSAKTHLINQARDFYPALDLEALAHHRGSAFGAWTIPQPSQIDFENRLALGLMKLEARPQKWLFEDESRLIGHRVLPESFFVRLRGSGVVLVNEPFEQRVENIFADYVGNSAIGLGDEEGARVLFEKYRTATRAIRQKLGGARAQEVIEDLDFAERDFFAGRDLSRNREWIAKLLSYYYDPLYLGSLQRRDPKIIFQGTGLETITWLRSFRAGC